ncbi:hypothetical protein M758_7G068500 [Ceratodon purpureus]|nr:hypothetical protein M758_7G068500 [Ceratodon purpureus]
MLSCRPLQVLSTLPRILPHQPNWAASTHHRNQATPNKLRNPAAAAPILNDHRSIRHHCISYTTLNSSCVPCSIGAAQQVLPRRASSLDSGAARATGTENEMSVYVY